MYKVFRNNKVEMERVSEHHPTACDSTEKKSLTLRTCKKNQKTLLCFGKKCHQSVVQFRWEFPICLAVPRCCDPVLTALQFIIFQRQWWKEFHLGETVYR